MCSSIRYAMALQQALTISHKHKMEAGRGTACWHPLSPVFGPCLQLWQWQSTERAPSQGLLTCVALGLRPRGEDGGATLPRCNSLSSLAWRMPAATQSAVSGRASALCMQLSTPFFYYRYHAEDAWGRRACYKLSKSSRVHDACMGLVTSAYLTEKAPGGGRLSQCRSGSALQLPGWRPPAEAGPPICTHGRSSHTRGSPAHPGLLWLTMVPRCLSKAQERERDTHVIIGSC